MEKDSTSLTNDDIINSLKNRESPCLKTLYDNYSPKLLGMISMIVTNESKRLEILEKTFVRICLDIKTYDPMHSTLFSWIVRVAISESAKCMDLPMCEMKNKYWEVYKAQKTNIQ